MDALMSLDPNLIYLMLVFGLWAGVTASYIPGTGVAELLTLGSLGAAAAYLWQYPQTNWIAVLALSVGVLSFITFPFLPPRWRDYTLFGLGLQALGSWFLFDGMALNPILLLAILGLQLFYHRVVLVPTLKRVQDMKGLSSRDDQLIGQHGRMTSALDPSSAHPYGSVLVNSENWTASSDMELAEGDTVIVVGKQGLRLQVELLESMKHKVRPTEIDSAPAESAESAGID